MEASATLCLGHGGWGAPGFLRGQASSLRHFPRGAENAEAARPPAPGAAATPPGTPASPPSPALPQPPASLLD